jgi:hypothetical protein
MLHHAKLTFFRALIFSVALLLWIALLIAPAAQTQSLSPSTYYVDCSAKASGSGTEAAPWKSLAPANSHGLNPGDHLLLKRGTACDGPLTPQGSGAPNAPIVIDAYASGKAPIIHGGQADEALKLFNQQYWEINNLEITGGNHYGVHVSGDTPNSSVTHIYLRNLDVHGATFNSTKRADSGEVFISTNAPAQVLHDILIDGVVAHDTHTSEGIFVSAGGAWIEKDGVAQPLGSDVTVQNSVAHDVAGDGILISELTDGLLQKNVVYRSGICPKCTGSTPVGLWEWYCHTCTVQFNESYANDSWDGDGGDFDIDYYNDDNVVQYNYGHDSAGYCVAFFGAGGRASHHNIFRYNICSNNGRKVELAHQGEIFLHTWEGGSLDGVEIYNNTIYWNPARNAAALFSDATFSGTGPLFFKNNIIYSTVPSMIELGSSFPLDHNVYWTISHEAPTWQVEKTTYPTYNAYQIGANQDIHSFVADPKLAEPAYHAVGRPATAFRLQPDSPAIRVGANICAKVIPCHPAKQDFWGNPIALGHVNIGAYQGP